MWEIYVSKIRRSIGETFLCTGLQTLSEYEGLASEDCIT